MSDTPWRIAFPLVVDPVTRLEHIGLVAVPITPGRPDLDPSHCKVLGIDRKGKYRQFTMTIRDYRMAEATNAISLIELPGNPAPKGGIMDTEGNVMNADPTPAALKSHHDSATDLKGD